MSENNEDSVESEEDCSENLCYVYSRWQPEEIRGCITIVFATSRKFDISSHWTHLKHCSQVSVEEEFVFRCSHCINVKSTTVTYMFIYKIGKKSKTIQIMSFLDSS